MLFIAVTEIRNYQYNLYIYLLKFICPWRIDREFQLGLIQDNLCVAMIRLGPFHQL